MVRTRLPHAVRHCRCGVFVYGQGCCQAAAAARGRGKQLRCEHLEQAPQVKGGSCCSVQGAALQAMGHKYL